MLRPTKMKMVMALVLWCSKSSRKRTNALHTSLVCTSLMITKLLRSKNLWKDPNAWLSCKGDAIKNSKKMSAQNVCMLWNIRRTLINIQFNADSYFLFVSRSIKYLNLKTLKWSNIWIFEIEINIQILMLIVILGAAAVSLSCQILTFSGSGNNVPPP